MITVTDCMYKELEDHPIKGKAVCKLADIKFKFFFIEGSCLNENLYQAIVALENFLLVDFLTLQRVEELIREINAENEKEKEIKRDLKEAVLIYRESYKKFND